MTDTESDFIKQSREYFLGATEEGFADWLAFNSLSIPPACEMDMRWEEYLDDLEFARTVEIEKERTK